MNVLSLFDGMSCGQIALNRAGIKYDKYYASEIDKYAIKVTQANYPKTMQIGDVRDWKHWKIEQPELIMGGSPCQGFSFAGKQLNFNDPRSRLFFDFVDIIKHYKPKYFLLENVKMKKEYRDIISKYLGVEPIEINSSLVSAQNRKRLYWTNIHGIIQPKDRGFMLCDIIENGITDRNQKQIVFEDIDYKNFKTVSSKRRIFRNIRPLLSKANSLTASNTCNSAGNGCTNIMISNTQWRKLTPLECERLQTVPDNYTNHVSNTQRYKMLGNGWTVDVIAHILSYMK